MIIGGLTRPDWSGTVDIGIDDTEVGIVFTSKLNPVIWEAIIRCSPASIVWVVASMITGLLINPFWNVPLFMACAMAITWLGSMLD
jgi:hypothetical protein